LSAGGTRPGRAQRADGLLARAMAVRCTGEAAAEARAAGDLRRCHELREMSMSCARGSVPGCGPSWRPATRCPVTLMRTAGRTSSGGKAANGCWHRHAKLPSVPERLDPGPVQKVADGRGRRAEVRWCPAAHRVLAPAARDGRDRRIITGITLAGQHEARALRARASRAHAADHAQAALGPGPCCAPAAVLRQLTGGPNSPRSASTARPPAHRRQAGAASGLAFRLRGHRHSHASWWPPFQRSGWHLSLGRLRYWLYRLA